MKKLILLMVLFPMLSIAGNPGEDPAIAHIRTKFANGKAPSLDHLKPNSKWKCLEKFAESGNFAQDFIVISFSSFDGMIQPVYWELDGNSQDINRWQSKGMMVFTTKGLLGHGLGGTQSQRDVYLARIDINDSSLILERSTPANNNYSDFAKYTTSAIFSHEYKAIAYALCPVEQILP